MAADPDHRTAFEVAQRLREVADRTQVAFKESYGSADHSLADFDRRITDLDIREAARERFASGHHADAVEASVKRLNEVVRARSGSALDGDALMTTVFSPNGPILRVNRMRSQTERDEQRGHMMLCQGVVAAWRNPRAHSSSVQDEPEAALMMLELVQHLLSASKTATRTRKRKVK